MVDICSEMLFKDMGVSLGQDGGTVGVFSPKEVGILSPWDRYSH